MTNGHKQIIKKSLSLLRQRLFFEFLCCPALFDAAVAEPKRKVCADHEQVEDVKRHHDIGVEHELVDDARDIADDDRHGKQGAFAACGAAAVGFYEGNGPRKAKTKQHDSFKNTHGEYPFFVQMLRLRPEGEGRILLIMLQSAVFFKREIVSHWKESCKNRQMGLVFGQ